MADFAKIILKDFKTGERFLPLVETEQPDLSTFIYTKDNKLYYKNSNGEEQEFSIGSSISPKSIEGCNWQ